MSSKLQASSEAEHSPPIDTARGGQATHGQSVQEVASKVNDLAARVNDLEQQVKTVPNVSTVPETGAANQSAGPTLLEDVLPDIKKLAEKVGGLERLAELVDTLKRTKQ